MKKHLLQTVLLSIGMAILFSGCLFQSPDALYVLPQQTQEYYDLQAQLDALLTAGAQYSAPIAGDNQQAIQMADLTGDGNNEVIVFLNTSGEKPLKIYVYSKKENHYTNIAVIERDGSAFDRVDYLQMDGQSGLEMAVGTQVSDQVLQSLSVSAVNESGATELMTANYFKYTVADLDNNGCQDIVTFCSGEAGSNGVAQLYRYTDGIVHSDGIANLSVPLEAGTICRIMAGNTQENVRAVLVASTYKEEELITDVLAMRNGAFTNIALAEDSSHSAQTVRSATVYSTDIDADGLIELPSMLQMQNVDAGDTKAYYLINWYNLTLDGRKVAKRTTYYNSSDGWYLTIPDEWKGNISVQYGEDESGYSSYTFYLYDTVPQEAERIATIYTFCGTEANTLATSDGRFVLAKKGDLIFAANIGTAIPLEQNELTELFHFIKVQWNSGEM